MAASSLSAPPPLTSGSRLGARRTDVLQRRDGLTKGQLRAVIAAIAAIHVGGGWALLQVPAVRDAVVEAVPIFVNFVPPPQVPKAEVPPPPPPPPSPPRPRPTPKSPPPPPTVVAAPPSPAPAPFVAAPPPPVPVLAAPTPPAPEPPPPAPPAPPPPPPVPQDLPISAIRYARQVEPNYPSTSVDRREEGVVMVQVLIDDKGMPNDVRVAKSSGFPRLDASAVDAVKRFRFHPAVVNGRPAVGYAKIPVEFKLPE